jgi:predicted amidohydrolase YtcJ
MGMQDGAVRLDTVLLNGIVRQDTVSSPHGAIGILHGRVVALGDDAAQCPARKVIDLGGATVLPGFHDAHNHMAGFGATLDELDLRSPPLHRVEEVLDLIYERAQIQPEGSWIIGSGYNQNKLGGHPTREGIDRAAPRHLVWLKHTSGHMCVVGSALLDQLDLANCPPGGDVGRDADGRPNGLLREQAQLLLAHLTYPVPMDVVSRSLARASARYVSEGLTSVQEAGIGGGLVGHTPLELAAYQEARQSGSLQVRTTVMVALEALHDLVHHHRDLVTFGLDLGVRSGFGDDWLRIGAVKIFADGSLIGRTAALNDDYADEPGNRGYFQLEENLLRQAIFKAHVSGWQIATHAIGDRAVGAVLDSYRAALAAHPRPDHRHRIEHCGISNPDQVATMAQMGVIPVPQGRFINELGDGMRAAVGEDRVAWTYRSRSFLEAGIPLPASSDRPVVSGTPLVGLADLRSRRTSSGASFGSAEDLDLASAVRAYTWGSAHAAFLEDRLGTLEPGKLADLVVLSRDLLDPAQPDALEAAQVLGTMVGGELVFDAGNLS